MNCKICGCKQDDDLLLAVTQELACSTCVLAFDLWTPVRQVQIDAVRKRLGLKGGEYHSYDRGAAAAAILGRS